MRIKTFFGIIIVPALVLVLSGCKYSFDSKQTGKEITQATVTCSESSENEGFTDEQVLSAVINYCCINNPSLEEIINEGEYLTYWDIASSDENEIVVLYRSYTGAEIRYYADRYSGETYVTEYVDGITSEEEKTGEKFNIADYFD